MMIGIHQPNFLPWLGYFAKLMKSDIFVLLDTVQFSKGGYQNRVQIKTSNGSSWLTASVTPSKIREGEIDLNRFHFWKTKHLKTMSQNYSKSPHFDYFFDQIYLYYNSYSHSSLFDFNLGLIRLVCNALGESDKKIILASNLKQSGEVFANSLKGDDRLIDICKTLDGSIYLSGQGGKQYQDDQKFEQAGLSIDYDIFEHPQYPQLWGDFEKGLSVLDLLFNTGQEAGAILRSSLKLRI